MSSSNNIVPAGQSEPVSEFSQFAAECHIGAGLVKDAVDRVVAHVNANWPRTDGVSEPDQFTLSRSTRSEFDAAMAEAESGVAGNLIDRKRDVIERNFEMVAKAEAEIGDTARREPPTQSEKPLGRLGFDLVRAGGVRANETPTTKTVWRCIETTKACPLGMALIEKGMTAAELDRADDHVIGYTGFKNFGHLLAAINNDGTGYTPTFFCVGNWVRHRECRELADLYDRAQQLRGDPRRASRV